MPALLVCVRDTRRSGPCMQTLVGVAAFLIPPPYRGEGNACAQPPNLSFPPPPSSPFPRPHSPLLRTGCVEKRRAASPGHIAPPAQITCAPAPHVAVDLLHRLMWLVWSCREGLICLRGGREREWLAKYVPNTENGGGGGGNGGGATRQVPLLHPHCSPGDSAPHRCVAVDLLHRLVWLVWARGEGLN